MPWVQHTPRHYEHRKGKVIRFAASRIGKSKIPQIVITVPPYLMNELGFEGKTHAIVEFGSGEDAGKLRCLPGLEADGGFKIGWFRGAAVIRFTPPRSAILNERVICGLPYEAIPGGGYVIRLPKPDGTLPPEAVSPPTPPPPPKVEQVRHVFIGSPVRVTGDLVLYGDRSFNVAKHEAKILEVLSDKFAQPVSTERLREASGAESSTTVEVWISKLRNKLNMENLDLIITKYAGHYTLKRGGMQ